MQGRSPQTILTTVIGGGLAIITSGALALNWESWVYLSAGVVYGAVSINLYFYLLERARTQNLPKKVALVSVASKLLMLVLAAYLLSREPLALILWSVSGCLLSVVTSALFIRGRLDPE